MRPGSPTWFSDCASAFAAALLCCATASAQPTGTAGHTDLTTLTLDELLAVEVVAAASRYEQTLSEAPASVTVISADEIRAYGWRTLPEILRAARGLYLTYDRNYHYLGMRGISQPGDYTTRVLMLVDGHRLNEPVFGSAPVGTDFLIDVDLIDRVEIIRGPGSALYGTSALLGVVNVVTKSGVDAPGLQGAAGAGRFSAYDARASWGTRVGRNGSALLAAGIADARGPDLYFEEFDTPETHDGMARGLDDERVHRAFGRLDLGRVRVAGAFTSRTKGIPTAPWDTVFGDGRAGTTDERGFVQATFAHGAAGDQQVTGSLAYDYYDYVGAYPYAAGEPDGTTSLLSDLGRAHRFGGDLQGTRRFRSHLVTTGAEIRSDTAVDLRTFWNGTETFRARETRLTWAVFAQDEWSVAPAITLLAGIRRDQSAGLDGSTTPRAALLLRPANGTILKALYGQAFRAPNAYERYYNDGDVTAKAPDALRSELINTFEMVAERRLTSSLRATVSAFRYWLKDLISLTTDPVDGLLVFHNIDAAKTRGLEMELRGRWSGGVAADVSHVWQTARNNTTSERLPNSPARMTKARLTMPLYRRLVHGGFEVLHEADRQTAAGDVLGSFVTANGGLRLGLGRMEASAGADNLFNARYVTPGSEEHRQVSIRQDGRVWYLRVRWWL